MCANLPMYYADKNDLMLISWGGGICPPFVHVDKGGEVVKCPRLSTRGGEGVKIGQNWSKFGPRQGP